MIFILAAIASLGLLFAWALSVALGYLKIGTELETIIFFISAGLPLLLTFIGAAQTVYQRYASDRKFKSY